MKGRLFMIPTYLSETAPGASFPQKNIDIVSSTRHFAVEEARTARRFLRSVDRTIDIDSLTMAELNEHHGASDIPRILSAAERGEDVGMISEAGCPGVADPGAELAAEAHRRGLRVVPLVGPSSIVLGLMASGLNGQNFAFCGYLPIGADLPRRLRQMEERSMKENQTQIFIETPYRNDKMLQALLQTLRPATRLCVARSVTGADELIATKSVEEWRKGEMPELHKRPTVFLFLA